VAEALQQLPSETDAHYTMLVSAIMLLSGHLTVLAVLLVGGLGETITAQIIAARTVDTFLPPDGSVTDLPPEAVGALADAQQIANTVQALQALVPLLLAPAIAIGAVLLGALLVYRLRPASLLRHRRAVPLADAQSAAVIEDLQGLGLTTLARIYLVPATDTDHLRVERADGHGRNQHILVASDPQLLATGGADAELVLSWRQFRAFRAGLLHEAAHLQNDDVRRVNWSFALQIAFYTLILGPVGMGLAAAASLGMPLANLVLLTAQFALMVVTIRALWAGLLRVREYYADWWAVTVGDLHDDLADLLEETGHRRQAHARQQGRRLYVPWRALWRHHPTEAERVQAIEDPAGICCGALRLYSLCEHAHGWTQLKPGAPRPPRWYRRGRVRAAALWFRRDPTLCGKRHALVAPCSAGGLNVSAARCASGACL